MANATTNYQPVKEFEAIDIEEPFLPNLQQHRRHQRQPFSTWVIVLMTVFLTMTIICVLQAIFPMLRPKSMCMGVVEQKGFSTEWDLLTGTIESELVTYTNAFRYNETGKNFYREFDPAEPQYVGEPSPEIDQAWNDLLYGQYLVISEEEAQHLENPVPYKGAYMAEPEVMHSLHCVNAIRKALSHEYYMTHGPHKLPAEIHQIHVDHCLDQIRQNIQCAGDLTPVPLRPYGDEPHINLVGTPQVHTCRNWSKFRQSYTQRGQEYGHVTSGGT